MKKKKKKNRKYLLVWSYGKQWMFHHVRMGDSYKVWKYLASSFEKIVNNDESKLYFISVTNSNKIK